ncbi:von Willebrand factor, type A [Cordyceps fumosorosea ARSEF 2679]|uniref:von Willebrand factor, type A n=1 Tax=Cordyceps fumosorosea (strain ARSEF 2679) TaxID=1081104 RepID=A0A168CG98_CORFA|nr:von Willebrand factor, type A [Cordyceps fumosorosea ARSEF 2679]OAA71338.1 von Willebrand factor, type A [Cordyceps fumosorosea ARSEF 2679]
MKANVGKHPCLMHGMLAVAAAHDRYLGLTPSSRRTLRELSHWSQCTILFAKMLRGTIKEEFKDACWATASTLGILSFASTNVDLAARDPWPLGPADSSDLEWLRLGAGKMKLWQLLDPLRPQSACQPMHRVLRRISEPLPERGADGIPRDLAECCGMDASSTADSNAYHNIAHGLAQLDGYDGHDGQKGYGSALRVSGHMSGAFEARLREKDVVALGSNTVEAAVTAYYDNPDKYSSPAVTSDKKSSKALQDVGPKGGDVLPTYQLAQRSQPMIHNHTNVVIQAAHVRAQDEQDMQTMLQTVQFQFKLYNPDLEPEHEFEGYCDCLVHQYQRRKWDRRGVQTMWSKAVMYPGEKAYDNCYTTQVNIFSSNPYRYNVTSPYIGRDYMFAGSWTPPRPRAYLYTQYVRDTIALNAHLNAKAQADIDAQEPPVSIWQVDELAKAASNLSLENNGARVKPPDNTQCSSEKTTNAEKTVNTEKATDGEKNVGSSGSQTPPMVGSSSAGNRQSWFKKIVARKTPEQKEARRLEKLSASCGTLRNAILQEEHGRWPTQEWRRLVAEYQAHVGMTRKIAELRERYPIQYLQLLRAGYFEPIPVAWADQASNPLKFRIEGMEGWRGITPTWRGFEDTAEERLYWVLNHREGMTGPRLKPDMISALNMARQRMACAVEPPPQYFSQTDTCHLQHTSAGYSKQVMAPPFRAFDAPETAADDTMILLDTSGSMDFDPVRPNYSEYLITGYSRSTQPKNRDVAKAIIRRFVDAMTNHSHSGRGYQLVTFANHASYMGVVNHQNLDSVWRQVQFGGGTRVMTGWQRVKRLHFERHRASATHHPVFGWQAGPGTPTLRLLLLLDGEATDMDEFELDLLANAWAHVTIFLIGVDGCPHHHRHANELQRIGEANHHVSFVDAVGNMPERLVTHELLKRHLGYEVSMAEFVELEQPPAYTEV